MRLDQPNSSPINIYESSSIPIVKGMDPYEASSTALHLPTEEWINQVGDSEKVRNSIRWHYLIEFMLDVIRAPWQGS